MQDASDINIGDTIEAVATPPKFDLQDLEKRVSAFVTDSTDKIVKAARDNPKAAVAAGAAVVVGAIAAATIPAILTSKKKPVRKAAAKPAAKPAAAKPAAPRRAAAKKAS